MWDRLRNTDTEHPGREAHRRCEQLNVLNHLANNLHTCGGSDYSANCSNTFTHKHSHTWLPICLQQEFSKVFHCRNRMVLFCFLTILSEIMHRYPNALFYVLKNNRPVLKPYLNDIHTHKVIRKCCRYGKDLGQQISSRYRWAHIDDRRHGKDEVTQYDQRSWLGVWRFAEEAARVFRSPTLKCHGLRKINPPRRTD